MPRIDKEDYKQLTRQEKERYLAVLGDNGPSEGVGEDVVIWDSQRQYRAIDGRFVPIPDVDGLIEALDALGVSWSLRSGENYERKLWTLLKDALARIESVR